MVVTSKNDALPLAVLAVPSDFVGSTCFSVYLLLFLSAAARGAEGECESQFVYVVSNRLFMINDPEVKEYWLVVSQRYMTGIVGI
jgi:hypothetical protein